jgi:hypothetical protein
MGPRPLPVVTPRPDASSKDEAGPLQSPVQISVDPFALEGFERADLQPRPAQVPADIWEAIFPPDRAKVIVLAGHHLMAGKKPADAVRFALDELDELRWQEGMLGAALKTLAPCFGVDPDVWPLPAPLRNACQAVYDTSRAASGGIISATDMARESFLHRRWRAGAGTCLVCGKSAAPAERRFAALWQTSGSEDGDAIHAGCMDRMRAIGPVFGRLVSDASAAVQASLPPPVQEDPSVDPDDPSTYLDG